MVCEKCGMENEVGALFCSGCGNSFESTDDNTEKAASPAAEETAVLSKKPVRSYMAAAIATTVLLGNWVLGIPAIVFARECEYAAEKGMEETARRFSRRALAFMCIGSGLSLAFISLILLITVLTRMVIIN